MENNTPYSGESFLPEQKIETITTNDSKKTSTIKFIFLGIVIIVMLLLASFFVLTTCTYPLLSKCTKIESTETSHNVEEQRLTQKIIDVSGVSGMISPISLSQDGKRIVYAANSDSGTKVYINDEGGRNYDHINNLVTDITGNNIVYTGKRASAFFVVYNNIEDRPYPVLMSDPVLSADGKHFAYIAMKYTSVGSEKVLVVNGEEVFKEKIVSIPRTYSLETLHFGTSTQDILLYTWQRDSGTSVHAYNLTNKVRNESKETYQSVFDLFLNSADTYSYTAIEKQSKKRVRITSNINGTITNKIENQPKTTGTLNENPFPDSLLEELAKYGEPIAEYTDPSGKKFKMYSYLEPSDYEKYDDELNEESFFYFGKNRIIFPNKQEITADKLFPPRFDKNCVRIGALRNSDIWLETYCLDNNTYNKATTKEGYVIGNVKDGTSPTTGGDKNDTSYSRTASSTFKANFSSKVNAISAQITFGHKKDSRALLWLELIDKNKKRYQIGHLYEPDTSTTTKEYLFRFDIKEPGDYEIKAFIEGLNKSVPSEVSINTIKILYQK